jgi:GT2 family glycosyltransferase
MAITCWYSYARPAPADASLAGAIAGEVFKERDHLQGLDVRQLFNQPSNSIDLMVLTIIIVNYKSTRLVLDCLGHLYRDPVAKDFDVFIVDNASGDDSEQVITAAFPRVWWIGMTYNAGFARANNEGIRRSAGEEEFASMDEPGQRSAGDAVLLLNGDTLPDAGVIASCYQRLMDSDYVAAGVQLLNSDGSPQISGMYVMKGGLNYLLPLPFLGTVIRKLGEMAGIKKPHVAGVGAAATSGSAALAAVPIEVDWINGAFLMVKRSAILQAGLLDEDFFLYAEEAEWCGRLRKTGPLCIYGDLKMIHLQGETANKEFGSGGKGYYNFYDRKGLQIMLSNFVRIRKQFGICWFLVQLFFYLADIPVFFIGLVFSKRYSFAQFRNYCKNIGIILRLSPTIIANKPYFYKVL